MKYRESGMPPEDMWDSFFSPEQSLEKMGVNEKIRTFVDIGCGYGTFLIPAARLVSGIAVGIDIDKAMIEVCKRKIRTQNIDHIQVIHGDISTTPLNSLLTGNIGQIDYISLFNILHCEEPIQLLQDVKDILSDDGYIGVIHWKYEETPRGPSMEIRPTPQVIVKWANQVGLSLVREVELPPYHFGLIFSKNAFSDNSIGM